MATRKPRSPASQPLLVGVEASAPGAAAPGPTEPPAAAPPSKKKPAAPRAPAKKKAAKVPSLIEALSSFLAGTLVADLEQRAQVPAVEQVLRRQWSQERAQNRSAEHYEGFRRRICLQVGASWLLCGVFVRTLEDRQLLERRRLAGEGAEDSERLFFEQFPSLGHRDYLLAVFREVGKLPGASSVLGVGQAPAYRLGPSSEVARELLKIFRILDDATGALRYRFEGEDTRLLGDLYQDLSEDIRERYALLQTPDFVEEFILDLTLTPAIDTFGLEQVRLLDPTCGSGHFLLGAFHRLVERYRSYRPGLHIREIAKEALKQVYGVDLNPYAIAIARFRLTLAFVQVAKIKRLREITTPLPLHLVVADSLLIAARKSTRRLGEVAPDAGYNDRLFDLEDPEKAYQILGQGYHAVVGNPPYITCKDAALRDHYRELYDSAHRLFALAAPFTERFFQLGVPGGFVGLINANSFMKREFGKPLVEKVLPSVDLTHVIDTAGAFIPGHGTPTVILLGRNQRPASDSVRAVLGKRGEPSTPDQPENGLVWLSIAQHVNQPEFENDFVSVANVERKTFAKHPWSLGGGGASDLKELLEERAERRLSTVVSSIGFMCITKQDDVFSLPTQILARNRIEPDFIRQFVIGENVRDWQISPEDEVVFPYEMDGQLRNIEATTGAHKYLWCYRVILESRAVFGGKTFKESGRPWQAYGQIPADRIAGYNITFAFVATHNHFVLDRGGKVFNRSAPIIKLPAGATEDDHLALLGYLNSSTACFWMKQVFFPKYGAVKSDHPDPARNFYEFAGTGLLQIPIPAKLVENKSYLAAIRELSSIGEERSKIFHTNLLKDRLASCGTQQDVLQTIEFHWAKSDQLRRRAIYLQEEIDWFIYSCFQLVTTGLAPLDLDACNELTRGQRAFEEEKERFSLIRKEGKLLLASEAEVENSPATALTESQKTLRIARRTAIKASSELALIETNVFKRLWRDVETNETEKDFRRKKTEELCSSVLLQFIEKIIKDLQTPVMLNEVFSRLESEKSILGILEYFEKTERNIWDIASDEAVPYLAAYRHSEAGMAKRREWEETWALQRQEDAGAKVDVPVPPKYDSKDFRRPEYWSLRGKLDVPKERFISYPGAEDEQGSPMLGWAGWDHLQRATALAGLYQERKEQQGWEGPRLVPLLAGLWELVPWLKQWHNEPNEAFQGERLGDYFATFVIEEARLWGKTPADLEAWRPGK
jgi:hypothetical protein